MNEEEKFDPKKHLIQIKNRNSSADYLPVQFRLVWFRENCPEGTIETELLHLDLDRETEEEGWQWNEQTRRSEKVIKRAHGIAVFHATVKDGKGGVAQGTKSEKAASFPDFIEKAETGSIGRALAALGYGTQFAPDLDEQHRIVDAPVERPQQQVKPTTEGQQIVDAVQEAPASKEAIDALNKLRLALGMPLSKVKHTRQSAKEEYEELLTEWKEREAKGRAS